jgi:hypothetical protein
VAACLWDEEDVVCGTLAAWVAVVAFSPPDVRGDATCPSPTEVASLLSRLLPSSGADDGRTLSDVVEIATGESAPLVRLVEPGGRVAREHRLDAGASCSERASEAAVVIATWEANLHADVPFPPAPRASASDGDALTPPAPAASAPSRSPAFVAVSAPVSVRAAAPPRFDERPEVGPTIGGELLLATPSSGDSVPGGLVEVTGLGRERTHGRASLSLTDAHSLALAPGTVTWRRAALGIGVINDVWRPARLRFHLDALMTMVVATGAGYSSDSSATSWQPGAAAGLQGGVPVTSRLAVWADVTVEGFPGTERVSVLNVTAKPQLPSWEAQAGVGVSFSFAP